MATAKFKIKKGDEVIVLTGKDKGKKGTITEMITAKSRAVVQGINMVKRHTRQTQTEEGGIKSKEASIHVSNLALIDPKSGAATKAGFKIEKDGTKVRISRASGEKI
ncbi:LSU ribosomal protein L24p (L26e) [hydrothermal vent metagenome]|uniref:LSU ribosomal protein L24p (L26e) n=1 Tax=hydrothermal vent metagenome TaxID=652676 RepID=A0A3B1ATS0_9ZZZZ|nr:50S ribosomal protein L24 [Emcibacter sp.]